MTNLVIVKHVITDSKILCSLSGPVRCSSYIILQMKGGSVDNLNVVCVYVGKAIF